MLPRCITLNIFLWCIFLYIFHCEVFLLLLAHHGGLMTITLKLHCNEAASYTKISLYSKTCYQCVFLTLYLLQDHFHYFFITDMSLYPGLLYRCFGVFQTADPKVMVSSFCILERQKCFRFVYLRLRCMLKNFKWLKFLEPSMHFIIHDYIFYVHACIFRTSSKSSSAV